MQADLVVRNAGQVLTMEPSLAGAGEADRALGLLSGGAVAVRAGRVAWVGPSEELESAVELAPGGRELDAAGGVVTPGLVDPHTHLVFAGSRHAEFALRLGGASYLEVLKAGGGILSTVKATREASEQELVASARARVLRMLRFGVTTCEVKSGYGLELEAELKMLRTIRAVAAEVPVRLVPTFLGAHAVPAEHRDRPARYVEIVCDQMIPEVARQRLATMCDVYLEDGAFDLASSRRILEAGRSAGLLVRLHAGQFNDLGGPALAAELGASSADHLERFDDAGLRAMAGAGVVACLLPGAALSTGMRFPDARAIRAAGVEVALATDCNPGSSRTENLPLMTTLATVGMGLSIEDALRGVTRVAARALGLEAEAGVLEVGRRADLVVFDVPDYRCLAYHFGVNHARAVVAGGEVVVERCGAA